MCFPATAPYIKVCVTLSSPKAVSGQLTFAADASSATVTVPVMGSKRFKPNQTFVLNLSKPTDAILKNSRATGTIESAVAAPSPFAKGVGINFEPAGGPVVTGYLEDTGLSFSAQGDGLTFGWSTDNTAGAIIRHKARDPRYDTFNMLGAAGSPNWQISLPNGRYKIKIVAGDPSNFTNAYQVDANGTLVLSGSAHGKRSSVSGTATIDISNGVLTLTPGSGVSFDDLNFLNLKYVGALS